LARLAVHGDVYKVGATPYFVAPIDDDMLDTVIAALGAAEDDEENGDMEPNTGDDEPSIGGYEDRRGRRPRWWQRRG
jgi:hypothetical protein